jgi:ATP-dependent Clp protease ATP-binding subunit ClpC
MEKIGFATDSTEKHRYEEMKTKVLDSLKDNFRPEFINRLDEIIVFDVLSPEAIEKIVSIEVDKVKTRLKHKDIRLEVSSEALKALTKDGYNPEYGARPLKRLIQNKILTPLASHIVRDGLMKGGTVLVSYKEVSKGVKDFSFEVKKGKVMKTKRLQRVNS